MEQTLVKRPDDRIISSYEMKEILGRRGDDEFKIFSRLPTLDKLVDGFVEGELISISGPTKHGKTTLCQSLTAAFTEQNGMCLWFSFESMPKYFFAAFPKLPLFYLPMRLKSNDLTWVITKMIESKKEYGTRIVFLDHLHFLLDLARTTNASIEVGSVIRRLKTAAVQNGLIVFLMCHTVKGASILEGKDISHELIRDSSFVAQESDTVMLIVRRTECPSSNEAALYVPFSRRTGALNEVIPLVKTDGYMRERI